MLKAIRSITVPLLVCAASLAHAQDQTLGNAQVLATNGLFYGSGFSISSAGVIATTPAVGTFCFEDVNTNLYWLNGTALSSLAPDGTYTQIATLPAGSSCPAPANDGDYYGQSTGGGDYDDGTIYQMTPAGTVTSYYNFTGGPDGKGSSLPLLQGSNGEFYGANGAGDFYRYSTTNGLLPTSGTSISSPLYEGPDGSFFGVATATTGTKIIVQINPASQITTQSFTTEDDGQEQFGGDGDVYYLTYSFYGSGSACSDGVYASIQGEDLYNTSNMTSIGGFGIPDGQPGSLNSVEYVLDGDGSSFGAGSGYIYSIGPDNSCDASAFTSTLYPSTPPNGGSFYANLNTTATHVAPGHSFTLSWSAGAIDLTHQQCFGTGDLAGVNTPSGNKQLTPTVSGTLLEGFVCGGNRIAIRPIDVSNSILALRTSTGTTSFLPGATVSLVAFTTPSGNPSPNGSVIFKTGSLTIGSAAIGSNPNVATYTASTAGIAPGTYPVTAYYGGDALYNAATSPTLNVTITKIPSTTTLNSPESSYPVGYKVTLIATVADQVTGHTPTGSVTFYYGTTVLGSAKVATGDGTSTASITVPSTGIPPGSYLITAKYFGDTWNAASTAQAFPITITPATSSVTLTASPNPVSHSASLTLSATVTGKAPTGTVFFYAGSTLLGSNTLDNGAASIVVPGNTLAVGSYQLTANYAGDGRNPAATSSPVMLTVQ